jgi:hypothetical protein
VRPPLDRVAVRDRDAHELGDHRDREWVGQLLDHVHLARLGRAREELVHDPLDVRAERLDDAGREGLADQGAETRVVGRVAEQHGEGEPGPVRRGAEPALHQGLVPALAEARVAEDDGDVLVPGQHVEPEGMMVDGILGPEAVVCRIRVGQELGVEEVQRAHLTCPAECSASVNGRPSRKIHTAWTRPPCRHVWRRS